MYEALSYSLHYQGNVGSLLDVVRQCIVFDSMHDILRALLVIERDSEIELVRIKNRMSANFNSNDSGGKNYP